MLSTEEYKALKEKEKTYAVNFVAENIEASTDPLIMYRDSRPITDLKDMIESSASDEWYGDHVAFWEKDTKGGPYRSILYKEMLRRVNALGTALIDMGLKDKRISIIGENCSRWAMSYFAVVCGTGIAVPLDKELDKTNITELMNDADVEAVITTGKYEKEFREILAEGSTKLSTVINMNAARDEDGSFSWPKLVEKGQKLIDGGDRRFLDAQINNEDLAVLIYTSGTTGASKGVMISHKNLAADLMASPTVLKVNDWDIFFSVLPLHHTYECTSGFLMPMYKGAAIAYCEGLKYILKNLKEANPTMLLGVPAIFELIYKRVWKTAEKEGKADKLRKGLAMNAKMKKLHIDLSKKLFKDILAIFGSRMRLLIVGGAAINPEVLDFFRAIGINALQGYGLTECAPMGALNPDIRPKSTSCGRGFPGFQVKVNDPDEDGNGELWLKGDNVMIGYYKNPEATAEAVTDGWFHSGDIGYIDDEGYIYITGRKKNVIITKNGKNVFPEELEYYINNIPVVKESMVFAEENEDKDDILVVASVRLDDEEVAEKYEGREPSRRDLYQDLWEEIDAINQKVPFFKKIKRLYIRDTDFDKNTSQKIRRFSEENRRHE
jgi:Long-chain acyl-CoA synthetases (AMP-forming)